MSQLDGSRKKQNIVNLAWTGFPGIFLHALAANRAAMFWNRRG
jgi:hypothetical protein